MAHLSPNDRPLTPAEVLAEQAWAVHRALLIAEQSNPELRSNPLWHVHRADAFEHYSHALERC